MPRESKASLTRQNGTPAPPATGPSGGVLDPDPDQAADWRLIPPPSTFRVPKHVRRPVGIVAHVFGGPADSMLQHGAQVFVG